MAERKESLTDDDELTKRRPLNASSSSDENDEAERDHLECAVCLQVCVHPVQLPCGHIFCFLCVKGVANQSKRCAMCRKELPSGYLERPNLVRGSSELDRHSNPFDDGHQWFYEGHNGWWQYDERTSAELESAFKDGEGTCELLIAGFLYVIDFQNMVQFRRNDPSRRRRIKRDLISIPKKGIAGLRITDPTPNATTTAPRDTTDGGEEDDPTAVPSGSGTSVPPVLRLPNIQTDCRRSGPRPPPPKSPSPVPIPPNNTPQTPHTPSQDSGTSSPTAPCDPSFQRIVQDMESLLRNSVDLDDDEDDDAGELGNSEVEDDRDEDTDKESVSV